MDRLRIGEMARQSGVSEGTLRYYDRLGLLRPRYTDESNKYRYYDSSQNVQLNLIQHMKSLGMRLDEIKKQLDMADIPRMLQLLRSREADLERQMRALETQRDSIRRAIDSYSNFESYPPDGEVVLEFIPKRCIFTLENGRDVYAGGEDSYEEASWHLRAEMERRGLPVSFYENSGTVVMQDRIERRLLTSSTTFMVVSESCAGLPGVISLPGYMHICVYCNSFDREGEYAGRLLDEADRRGYVIVGDYLCEEMMFLTVMRNGRRSVFYRLAIPVRIPRGSQN